MFLDFLAGANHIILKLYRRSPTYGDATHIVIRRHRQPAESGMIGCLTGEIDYSPLCLDETR